MMILIYTMTIMCKWATDEMWNEWGDLKCPQKPAKQIDIDGRLFPDFVLKS